MSEEPGGQGGSFEERLKAARGKRGLEGSSAPKGSDPNGGDPSPLGIGLRVGTELIAAFVVAIAIGYGLDWVFGTRPILTAIFVLVGGAAGILNVWRVFAPKTG